MALPTDDTPAIRLRYAELGDALLAQFPGRLTQLDCGPSLGVVPYWSSPPTQAEVDAFAGTVAGWSWASTPDDLLDLAGLNMRQRVFLACVVRASGSWAGLSAGQKTRVQAIIDQAATRIIAAL